MLKSLSVVGYLGMVGGLLGQWAAGNLFSASPVVIVVQAGSLLLFVWARLTLRGRSFHVAANPTEGGLVTSGPYRHIRHPIYSAMSLVVVAGAAAHWSWGSVLLASLVLGCALLRILCEETLVTERYPEYRQYAANTWRMIPWLF